MSDPSPPNPADLEAPWMVQLYRGLASEAEMWRQRLDVTANWTVPLLVAVITFALGDTRVPHLLVLFLGWGIIAIAVFVEARRYQSMLHSDWRLRLIEVGYFAAQLAPTERNEQSWRRDLARDLRDPRPTVRLEAAAGARLRTIYLVMVYAVFAAWCIKVVIHPAPTIRLDEIWARLSMHGAVPGWATFGLAALVVISFTVYAWESSSLEVVGAPPAGERERHPR